MSIIENEDDEIIESKCVDNDLKLKDIVDLLTDGKESYDKGEYSDAEQSWREAGRLCNAYADDAKRASTTTANDFEIEDNVLVKYKGKRKNVHIPYGVTCIGKNAFQHRADVTKIHIPESVERIGWGAFYDCIGLTEIIIPRSVKVIENCAFYNCASLPDIFIPLNLTSIGENVFYACNGLSRIRVSICNEIYHSANNCLIETATKTLVSGCKNSSIPSDGSVTKIGVCAFAGLDFQNVAIPHSITDICEDAFRDCYNLGRVEIPDGVKTIQNDTFHSCERLSSVTIPNSVKSIGKHAFYGCTSLSEIKFSGTKKEWRAIEKDDGWRSYVRGCAILDENGKIIKD